MFTYKETKVALLAITGEKDESLVNESNATKKSQNDRLDKL